MVSKSWVGVGSTNGFVFRPKKFLVSGTFCGWQNRELVEGVGVVEGVGTFSQISD